MARPGRHRLCIDIPESIHKEMKKSVDMHYITTTKWIIRAIIERLEKEKKYQ